MLTFEDQYELAEEIAGLEDAASIVKFKRDINTGGRQLMAQIDRPFNRQSKFANIVAEQQYYQMSKEALRTMTVVVHKGTEDYPLVQIADEESWRRINQSPTYASPASHYFIRGNDEIGLFPIPSEAIAAGLEQVYEPRHIDFSESDYTTGTVTVTQGSTAITHSGTGFTADMVGRGFQITDGTDRHWYRVQSFTSTSELQLDNYYEGLSGSGKTFRIGQVFWLPEEYLEAPVDYAMYRHYLRQNDRSAAADFKVLYEDALKRIRAQYGKRTSNNVIEVRGGRRGYNPLLDTPNSIPT